MDPSAFERRPEQQKPKEVINRELLVARLNEMGQNLKIEDWDGLTDEQVLIAFAKIADSSA